MKGTFGKYESSGAYHWKASSACAWWKRDALTSARYALAIREIRRSVPRGAIGLDAGCGDGVALYELGAHGFRAIGIDDDAEGLRIARRELRSHGMTQTVVRGNVCRLPLADKSVSFALALDVIEHLADPAAFIDELRRVLDDSGVLVITTPMAAAALHDARHVREYTEPELRGALAARFRDVVVVPFTPLWLARTYRSARPRSLVNRVAALAHRALAALGANAFVHLARSGAAADDLLAVARQRC